MRAAAAVVAPTVLLLVTSPLGVRADSTAPGGLRGLIHTKAADTAANGTLEVGFFTHFHTLEDSGSSQHTFLFADLQVGFAASPYSEFGVVVPIRAWTVGRSDTSTIDPTNLVGFGDISASGKVQLPLPLGPLKLGAFGNVSFPTGSRSRGFSTRTTDFELGGITTLDFSDIESFVPIRVHLNASWRWNRNEAEGFGLAPLQDVGSGGFWPPAYPAVESGGTNADNDHLRLRGGLEFNTRILALFTEFSTDFLPNADGVPTWDSPIQWTQGGLLKFRNGLNIKAGADFSLQNDTPDPRYPQLPEWRLWLGVNWRISVTRGDADNDGIPNKPDTCADRAEDFDGFQDEDGCPDEDNDGDGVLDRDDLAPELPEDIDGFEDQDGRPDADNDGDGIRDPDDACPNDPEDFDGDRDTDGCPDIVRDSDGDGIVDEQDRCPTEPEDMDGVEDDDGCPEGEKSPESRGGD